MDNISAAKIKQAHWEICEAIAALQHAKATIVNLGYQTKQVEDLQYILEHLGQVACPSDDAHEAVFMQLEAAKQTLHDAGNGALWQSVRSDLSKAYAATDKAWSTIKR